MVKYRAKVIKNLTCPLGGNSDNKGVRQYDLILVFVFISQY